ncbi:MAG: hypothetical protein ACHQRM_00140 [Bacteroidia bacterium]
MTNIIRNRLFFYSFFTAIAFVSCNQQNKADIEHDSLGNKIFVQRDSSGKIVARRILIDSSKHSEIVLKYDNNGILADSFCSTNGKIEGIRKQLDDSDGVILTTYSEGVQKGEKKAYYSNGKMFYSGFKNGDKMVHEWNYYYKSGIRSSYKYYSAQGNLTYVRMYDNHGKLTLKKGAGIIEFRYKNDTVKLNDSFHSTMIIANPPNSTVTVFHEDLDKNENPVKTTQLQNNEGQATVVIEATKKGHWVLGFKWNIYDSITHETESGKQKMILYVK